MAFERFELEFGPKVVPSDGEPVPWRTPGLLAHEGYDRFVSRWAGQTFHYGLYRIHDGSTGPKADDWIKEGFPRHGREYTPFAYDWLGRQFALNGCGGDLDEVPIFIFEPGTGEVLEVPCTFIEFHDGELIDYTEAALFDSYFDEWRSSLQSPLSLQRDQCAGFRVPLFLGGVDDVTNLELIDIDVYWSFSAQMVVQVQD